jgi:uncharacterized protein YbjT (DUF2867 family)
MPGKNEPPRVLVTGASGKIGGAVATALDGTHGEVIAVRASPAAVARCPSHTWIGEKGRR